MRHPFYFVFALVTCVYLLIANWRGWSAFAATRGSWGTAGRSVYHK